MSMINEYVVSRYCCEDLSLIENYDKAVADETQTWNCHHRLEMQGDCRISPKKLRELGLYENRPASELIFLTKAEHNRLHMLDTKLSKETKQKISQANHGKKRSEETKRKISEIQFGKKMSAEACKNMSKAQSLLRWWNNGEKEIKAKSCPDGYSAGRLNSEDLAQQRSEAQHCRAVEQYSKDGKLLNTFESVSMASKEMGIQKTNIIHCCREIRQTAGGYKWKYK